MAQRLDREIATALDATPELLPFLPQLLVDLWDLGSPPQGVLGMLRPLDLPRGETRVLDLGCGKGAVAIHLARELGFSVLGVDAFAPFVEEARRRGEERGVGHLCRFECADLRVVLDRGPPVDVVIFASLGPVLGDLETTVGRLRPAVRPGGYLVIDDGFLTDEAARAPNPVEGYEAYRSHSETLEQLEAHGDSLVTEVVSSPEETEALNRGYTQLIRRRARELVRKHPESAELILDYVEEQEHQTRILTDPMVCASWLLRRGE